MIRMRKTRLSVGALLGGAAIVAPLTALAGPASASTPSPNAPTKVPSGINPSQLPGATVFGSTPGSTPETVSFILKENNASYLQAEVQQGVKSYLTTSQFATEFGQSPSNISALV